MRTLSADTACSNCKAEMPKAPKASGGAPINIAKMTITAYLCQRCGHWNDLKRRKSHGSRKVGL